MGSDSIRDVDYDLWVALWQTRDAIKRVREKELKTYGITAVKASVLAILQTIGSAATPAKVGRALLREPHGISVLVNRMVAEGLLRKANDLDKKNLVRVTVTEKGQRVYLQTTKRESIHQIMSCLSEEDRRQLLLCLRKLRNKALADAAIPEPPSPL